MFNPFTDSWNPLTNAVDALGVKTQEAIKAASEEVARHIETVDKKLSAQRTQTKSEIDDTINRASLEISKRIDHISAEIAKHRSLTSEEIKEIIVFATANLATAIDARVANAKSELSSLVTIKMSEIRTELTEVANEQKRTAIKNVIVAVSAAIGIGVISLVYRRLFHGEIDLMTVFRAILAATGCGHAIWLVQRFIVRLFSMSRVRRSVIVAGAQCAGMSSSRGALGHILLLVAVTSGWIVLTFWDPIQRMLTR